MKMRALDTFHTSTTRTVQAGAEFEIHAQMGRDLEKAGLAEVVEAGADEEPVIKDEEPVMEAKQEQPPDNKMIPAPANKRGPGRPRKAEPVEAEEPDEEGAE